MKTKIFLSVIFVSLNLRANSQTIPNAGFEYWTMMPGQYENPDNWSTNNAAGSISVSKTTDSYTGNYALRVINNGPSFEGSLPGYATIVYTSNSIVNKITAYVKCDSISGTGKGKIIVYGYSGTTIQQLGSWETSLEIPQYSLVQIPLNPVNTYDSILINIEAYAQMDGLGFPTGYADLKADQLTEDLTSGIKESNFNSSLKIFPNPFSEYTTLTFDNPKGKSFTLTVYDSLKRLVRTTRNITSGQIKVEGKKLPPGTYILKIKSDDGAIVKEVPVVKSE
ncbi:MAG TPA: T9SS type A sorting domain-containing protein [Bacteroidia bacterium]|nr:T9SS type A sorting domain-containing protein [Bacteroidia bacterium]